MQPPYALHSIPHTEGHHNRFSYLQLLMHLRHGGIFESRKIVAQHITTVGQFTPKCSSPRRYQIAQFPQRNEICSCEKKNQHATALGRNAGRHIQYSSDLQERIARVIDMGRIAIHYGWLPLILYIGEFHNLCFLRVGYMGSTPRPAFWK